MNKGTNPHLAKAYEQLTKQYERDIEAKWESGQISDEEMMECLSYTDDPLRGLVARHIRQIEDAEVYLQATAHLPPNPMRKEIEAAVANLKHAVVNIKQMIVNFERHNKFGVIEGGR